MTQRLTSDQLEDYIQTRKRMSRIYQSAILKAFLGKGGAASIEDVAKALLYYDLSQVEYCAIRTKNMVGKVLKGFSVNLFRLRHDLWEVTPQR